MLRSYSLLSLGLVAAQFALIASLLHPMETLLPNSPGDLLGTLCLVVCVLLFVWAFASMRVGNFSLAPEPRGGAQMVTRGPYRWIRHPMYTSVILGGMGALLTRATLADGLQCGLLTIVILAKIRREESLLSQRYQAYIEYKSRTVALLPGIF